MGSAARFIDTTADCVLVLEISHNLHVDENYQVDVKSLFPDGTSLSGEYESCDKEDGCLGSVLQGRSTQEHIE